MLKWKVIYHQTWLKFILCLQGLYPKYKDTERMKLKGRKYMYIMCHQIYKYILSQDINQDFYLYSKAQLQARNIVWDEEIHFKMIKGSVHQGDTITIMTLLQNI